MAEFDTLLPEPPKTITIGKIDMSTPLHGEDPDPIMQSFVGKIDLRSDEPEKVAATLSTPIAPDTRLKGRDLTVHIFKDNVLQDTLALIKDIVVTFVDGVLIEFTAHQDCADYIDLMEAAENGGNFGMNLTMMFSGGQVRTFVMDHLDFKVIKLSAMSDKDMVELHFTVRARTYRVLR